jgi:NAD(P)-dependent dehydrogenase (short-subunit alcohol dehydrogenase family)
MARDDFHGRAVLVTGASEGIGRAIAHTLAREGACLALAGREAARIATAVDECRDLGARAIGITGDVTREDDCRRLVEDTLHAFGTLDMLVSNAGRTMWARFEALHSMEVFRTLIDVNLMGTVYCTRHALPALRASGGRLVAVASATGLTGVPERTAYAASKHALVGFCDSLRIELRGSGVSVTVAAPDFVLTQTHRRAIGPDGKPLGTSPMQEDRIMTAERCAALIVEAARRRRRLCLTSARTRLGLLLKPFLPGLLDTIAADAIARRR